MLNRVCDPSDDGADALNTTWTVGCVPHVLLHQSGDERVMVEFFDVGGAKRHRISRPLFYTQINGRFPIAQCPQRANDRFG